MWQLIVRV